MGWFNGNLQNVIGEDKLTSFEFKKCLTIWILLILKGTSFCEGNVALISFCWHLHKINPYKLCNPTKMRVLVYNSTMETYLG